MLPFYDWYLKRFSKKESDPVDKAKRIINNIQRLVGVHDVFNDKKRGWTALSLITYVIFGGSFFYLGTFSQLMYLIQVLADKVKIFQAINCISATTVPLSKNIFMWTSGKRLKVIFEMSRRGLLSIPEGAAKTKMIETLHGASYVSWIVVFDQLTVHFVYLLVPFIFTVFGNERYLPTTPSECYGLSPKYESPFYEANFVITVLGTMFSAVNQTGYIVLFVILLSHLLGHFNAIIETLKEIRHILYSSNDRMTNYLGVEEKLLFCVKHYQFLMSLHVRIKELYRKIFGVHFLLMTLVLVTTLQTLNSWDIRNTLLTGMAGVLPLIVYCFGGEMLISAGNELEEAIYECGWELMEVKDMKAVKLMLCISQRSLSLTASDMVEMNRSTFGNVAQVVYKIYAVFN